MKSDCTFPKTTLFVVSEDRTKCEWLTSESKQAARGLGEMWAENVSAHRLLSCSDYTWNFP